MNEKHAVIIETRDGHSVRIHVHENDGDAPFVKIRVDNEEWHQVLPGQKKQGVRA